MFISSAENQLGFSLAFIGLALMIGLAGGIVNGVLIARFNITPILCTLGTQMAFTGLAVVVSGGRAVMVGSPDLLSRIGNDMFLAVPISFLIFIAVALLIAAVVRFTPYGYWLMLMGTNPKAAVFAGFPRNGVLVATYATSGLLAGIAGIIIAARNVNVKFDYGSSYLLVAILIAVMAGVKPEGGYGRVSAVALQLMSSLLNFGGLSNFVRDFAWGLLLLAFLAVGKYDIAGFFTLGNRQKGNIGAQPSGTRP
jgi:simple sugar transport system permease protein